MSNVAMEYQYCGQKLRGALKYQYKKKRVRRREKFKDLKGCNATAKLLRKKFKQDMQFLVQHKNYDTYVAPFRSRVVPTTYWDSCLKSVKICHTKNNSYRPPNYSVQLVEAQDIKLGMRHS